MELNEIKVDDVLTGASSAFVNHIYRVDEILPNGKLRVTVINKKTMNKICKWESGISPVFFSGQSGITWTEPSKEEK